VEEKPLEFVDNCLRGAALEAQGIAVSGGDEIARNRRVALAKSKSRKVC